jgi:enoyl-CoA hydratase
MEFTCLRIEKRLPLAQVTLNRPAVLNALNAETLAEFSEIIEELAADPAVRVILLAGAGRAFAAGADIRELAALTAEEGRAFALRGQSLLRRIETLDKPVIACIQGFALGGGCELAMACTLRLAADDARLVGRGAALKLLLTGATIDAGEALRIGLVDEVVPVAELMAHAEALALEIAANAPLALAETLQAVDEGLGLPLDLALLREAVHFSRICGTADKNEGTRAFLEKRPPAWKGE